MPGAGQGHPPGPGRPDGLGDLLESGVRGGQEADVPGEPDVQHFVDDSQDLHGVRFGVRRGPGGRSGHRRGAGGECPLAADVADDDTEAGAVADGNLTAGGEGECPEGLDLRVGPVPDGLSMAHRLPITCPSGPRTGTPSQEAAEKSRIWGRSRTRGSARVSGMRTTSPLSITRWHAASLIGLSYVPPGPQIRPGSGAPLRNERTSSTTVRATTGVPRMAEPNLVSRLNASSGPLPSSLLARTAATRSAERTPNLTTGRSPAPISHGRRRPPPVTDPPTIVSRP